MGKVLPMHLHFTSRELKAHYSRAFAAAIASAKNSEKGDHASVVDQAHKLAAAAVLKIQQVRGKRK